MNLEQWFATPIWYEYTDLDVEPIKQKCLQLREDKFENRVLSNSGGWQSTDINLLDFPEFHDLHALIIRKINEASVQIHPDFRATLDNVWININELGSWNKKHFHPNATLAGTVYINTDDKTGNIVFYDHTLRNHYPMKQVGSPLFSDDVVYTPKNGMIVLFPAWLEHEVQISASHLPRISISFNIRQIT